MGLKPVSPASPGALSQENCLGNADIIDNLIRIELEGAYLRVSLALKKTNIPHFHLTHQHLFHRRGRDLITRTTPLPICSTALIVSHLRQPNETEEYIPNRTPHSVLILQARVPPCFETLAMQTMPALPLTPYQRGQPCSVARVCADGTMFVHAAAADVCDTTATLR